MKKFLYSALFMLAATTMFVACNDDNDGPAMSSNPAGDAAGTYNGTWTIQLIQTTKDASGNSTVDTLFYGNDSGYVQLTSESAYVAKMLVQATDPTTTLIGDTLTAKVNISQIPSGYGFFNVISSTESQTLRTTGGISGQIAEGVLQTKFALKQTTEKSTIVQKPKPHKVTSTVTLDGSWSFTGKK